MNSINYFYELASLSVAYLYHLSPILSIIRAAEALHLTQPAISIQLKKRSGSDKRSTLLRKGHPAGTCPLSRTFEQMGSPATNLDKLCQKQQTPTDCQGLCRRGLEPLLILTALEAAPTGFAPDGLKRYVSLVDFPIKYSQPSHPTGLNRTRTVRPTNSSAPSQQPHLGCSDAG